MATSMTSKGQVTIPKRIRDRLGYKPGAKVDFTVADDGRVVLLPAGRRPPTRRLARLRGILKGGLSTDEIMRLTRGEG